MIKTAGSIERIFRRQVYFFDTVQYVIFLNKMHSFFYGFRVIMQLEWI